MSQWVEIDGAFYNLDHVLNIDIQSCLNNDKQEIFEIVFKTRDAMWYPYENCFYSKGSASDEVKTILGI